MRWSDAEKDAAEDLWNLWGHEWKQHAHDYPALGNRSTDSIAGYIKNNIQVAAEPIVKVQQGAWPKPGQLINGRFVGKRLFEIDQDAVLNHGSPGTISRPLAHSVSGCSARWAADAA